MSEISLLKMGLNLNTSLNMGGTLPQESYVIASRNATISGHINISFEIQKIYPKSSFF